MIFRLGKVLDDAGDQFSFHDAFVREANRLAQQLFVEHVRGIDGAAQTTVESRVDVQA